MSWKVLVTARSFAQAGRQAQELLRRDGCEIVFPPQFGPLKAGQVAAALAGMDAVVASLDEYSAEALESPAAARLKIVARCGAGYDAVDLAAATRRGIVVTYTPGLLDEAVADHTFALLLALARHVHESHAAMLRSEWKTVWGDDVAGKTLGLVGCGRIGQAVARRAGGFAMRLLAYAPHPKPEAEKLGVAFVSLDTLLAESDFVSLHAALNSRSRGLLGEAQLRQMKPTAYLINTARGALVDEAALARALREGRIAGAGLDVFSAEPLPADSPLRSAPNALFSPHQAALARNTSERVSLAAAQAVLDLLQGRRPQNVLNPGVFDSPALRAVG